MESAYEQERADVAYFMRRLYERGLTTTSGGNISLRVAPDRIVLSASSTDKARLQADGVAVVDMEGVSRTPGLRPSIEVGMHLAVYRSRPHVLAVVHAHPVVAGSFCCTDVPLCTRYTAEAYAIVGTPVFVPYAMMGTSALADRVAEHLGSASCALLENHGVLAVGKTLLEAFDRLEVLETAARHTLILRDLGAAREIPAPELREIDVFMGRA